MAKITRASSGLPPIVRNISDLKGVPKLKANQTLLLHFTAPQWTRAIKGIRSGKSMPKVGLRLKFIPDPDGGGFAQVECAPGRCEICVIQPSLGPTGVTLTCRCRPDPKCAGDIPTPPPGPIIKPSCRLSVTAAGIRCVKLFCRGECQLRLVQFRGYLWITCSCAAS